MVRVGSARIDENGKLKGGQPGDQVGLRELLPRGLLQLPKATPMVVRTDLAVGAVKDDPATFAGVLGDGGGEVAFGRTSGVGGDDDDGSFGSGLDGF